MNIDEALRQLRSIAERLLASGCHWRSERITESADAIEAAMREPTALIVKNQAGQIRLTTADGDAFDLYDNLGTKLYALPPHAAMEIRRLHERVNSAADGLLERDAEIERLTDRVAYLQHEMQRHLPILETLYANAYEWQTCAAGTGIATLNGYRAALTGKEGKT